MSVTSRQNGLSADDRSTIRSAILSSREMLESEFERQLERYGVYEEKRVPMSELGHLSLQDRETRREIDAALERELEATEDHERAYQNYVREATKEYLNRYVGLKTIEARGLVTETLKTKAEYGNRSYLHYTVDEIAGELTGTPDDGLSVALDLAFQEIGAEIRILFEDTDYTAIEPEFTVRRDVFDELNELNDDAWAADEAIGWVYQYFGEKEREEIDDRIDEENYKVRDTDIATKTQLFTPRYIVEWMVDNSLGRLWLEMHADETNIDDEDQCFYLAPLEESLIERDVKDVRDIKVLDPACGSGHMLFYAFDVLYEMYLEQGGVPEKQIPGKILKHNLFGIDIDPGAVQIAALSLYVKAKEREPDVTVDQINVISADAVLVNGEKKQEVLDRVDTELETRVLEEIWRSFENIREWGSLVRIEERIEEIIEEELERIGSTGQTEFTGDGRLAKQTSVVSFSGDSDESWDNVKASLLERVTELAEEALERNDPIEELFVGEVERSVQLLDFFVGDYDVVVSNPPYLGSGKMGDTLKLFVRDNYMGSADLYAAFIERCADFAGPDKYVSMITMETFMYQYSYRKMRRWILRELNFVDATHLRNRDEGYMNICFTLRKISEHPINRSKFNRLVENNNKEAAIRDIIKTRRQNKAHKDAYVVKQNSFKEIGKIPYWLGGDLLELFTNHDQLGDHAEIKTWLDTQGMDDVVIRKWWELAGANGNWKPLVTNGDGNTFYESINDIVLWGIDGKQLKNYLEGSPRNEEWYFEEGISYRNFSKFFCARYMPEGHIFGKHAIGVFCQEGEIFWLLSYLNSTLVRYVADGISPGLAFEKGDGEKLPYVEFDSSAKEFLGEMATRLISIRKRISEMQEINKQFNLDKFQDRISAGKDFASSIIFYQEALEADFETGQGIIDRKIWDEIESSQQTVMNAHDQFGENLSSSKHYINEHEADDLQLEFYDNVPTEYCSGDKYEEIVARIDSCSGDNLREISEALEVSPYTVAMVRHEHDLYTQDEKQEAAGRLLSYYLGCIMGRWDLDGLEADKDGIIVFDESFEDNIASLVRECMKLTYSAGEFYDRETEIEDMLGKGYVDWLHENFFRYHHCKEYRRRGQRIPIYWQLESDGGAFSCFLYYHSMDGDTISKLRGQYVDAKIRTLENHLGSLEREFESASEDEKRSLRNEIEEAQEQLEDVKDFGDRLDALIDDGFEPDFEAGIWENIQKVDEYDLLQTELDKL